MALLGTGIGLAVCPDARADQSYFIDEVVHFPAPCTQPTLWDDTYQLKSHMDAAGWSGPKWVDASAYCTDWREGCSPIYGSYGQDGFNADHHAFAIYSGHGNPATLYFGTQADSCAININDQARLGAMDGISSVAAVAMYNSCSTLHNGGYNEWLWQQLGFYDVVGANTAQFATFFDDTATKSNSQAWLDRVSGPKIVISYSNGAGTDCWAVSNGAKLKANTYTYPRGSGPACGQPQPPHTECILVR